MKNNFISELLFPRRLTLFKTCETRELKRVSWCYSTAIVHEVQYHRIQAREWFQGFIKIREKEGYNFLYTSNTQDQGENGLKALSTKIVMEFLHLTWHNYYSISSNSSLLYWMLEWSYMSYSYHQEIFLKCQKTKMSHTKKIIYSSWYKRVTTSKWVSKYRLEQTWKFKIW